MNIDIIQENPFIFQILRRKSVIFLIIIKKNSAYTDIINMSDMSALLMVKK